MPARELVWLGSTRRDLQDFPSDVQDVMGFALWLAQTGGKHPDAKPLHGFGGSGVVEIVDDHDGDTYRVVYTLSLPDAVYVLHAFQKKSKRGSATPTPDQDLIRQRLKRARELQARNVTRRRERLP